VLYGLLVLSIFRLPVAPDIGLDASWQMALAYAAEHGLQHGREIVFTYGPLGHLMSGVYTGHGLGLYLAWQSGSALLFAAGLYRFGRQLPGWRQAACYLFLGWFGTMYVDAMIMLIITIFGAMLLQPSRHPRALLSTMAALFAILSLIKFTHFMVCGVFVSVLTVYFAVSRNHRAAILLPGVFLGVFLGGWLLCGQAVGHLPDYVYYSLQLSLGYSGAMALYESAGTLALGLVAAGGALAYLALYFFTAIDRRRAGALVLIIGAALFMNWKHGFTRADGHVLAHFVSVLLLACTYPGLTQDDRRWDRLKQAVLLVAALASLGGIQQVSGSSTSEAPAFWNDRLRQTVTHLLDFPRYHAQLDATLAEAARSVARPGLQGYIAGETVDHLGSDQSITMLNGLNYVPRPTVQSYTTYTPALNRLDESFFRSGRSPRFVLQRYGSIDDRLPALDDSLTQKLLYQHYDYAMEEGGLLLWEKPAHLPPPDPAEEKIVGQQSVRFGERVTVPETGELPVWATIRIPQNLAGRVRQFLYKPPTLRIHLEDDRGEVRDLLLVRAMGEAGFILQPFFPEGADLIAYQLGQPARKIRWFSLHTMPGGESYHGDAIAIELRTIRPFKRASNGLQPDTPWRFRMMNRVPSRLVTTVPAIDVFLAGEHLLQMHPPSLMEFDISAPVTSLRAGIGLLSPDAYARPDGTDGVDFIVEWVGADGRVERLGSRFLDPKRRLEDRSRQILAVDLGGRHDGKLRLRTAAGPTGNTAFGWTYWTGIEIK
jgi:hypothetical protein